MKRMMSAPELVASGETNDDTGLYVLDNANWFKYNRIYMVSWTDPDNYLITGYINTIKATEDEIPEYLTANNTIGPVFINNTNHDIENAANVSEGVIYIYDCGELA